MTKQFVKLIFHLQIKMIFNCLIFTFRCQKIDKNSRLFICENNYLLAKIAKY
jgi:hypothetical protein